MSEYLAGSQPRRNGQSSKGSTMTLMIAIVAVPSPSYAQSDFAPWRMMHDWGWGGMWLGPIFMLLVLGGLIIGIAALVRVLAGNRCVSDPTSRNAREILDGRYARGEIDREDYLRRRDDMADRR